MSHLREKLREYQSKFNQMSIKWKIFLYLIGFCSLLIILLWLFQIVFLEQFYKTIKVNSVKSSGATIVRNIDNENLGDLVERMAIANDVCIEIIDSTGEILHSYDHVRDCSIHKMPDFEKIKLFAKTAENGNELLDYYNRDSFKDIPFNNKHNFVGRVPDMVKNTQETIVYSKIMTNSQGETIIILINAVITPVNATVTTLRVQLYYMTAIMIGFSILLALMIAKRVARPIESINDSAKVLATGDYEITFDGSGYKEINELSNTLNYAAIELSKVEDLRRELIANISHDLRTPLTLISGYAEVMRDLPDENNAENAQIIIDEAKRLTTLVNDVLDISKFQSGTQELKLSTFNLTLMIESVIMRINEMVKKDGYIIRFIYDEDVEVTADEIRISQAFYNLLTNAINYTGEDKMVMVKQHRSVDSVRIEVIDSGAGIPNESLPYIWERYYKVDKKHKRAVTGTGLGLSIVKSIIELHEGEYGVSSKVNEGSVFWFSLKR